MQSGKLKLSEELMLHKSPLTRLYEALMRLKTILTPKPSTKAFGDMKLIVGRIRPRASNPIALDYEIRFKRLARRRERDIILDKEMF